MKNSSAFLRIYLAMNVGAHLPASKGFIAALHHAQSLGLGCLQLFSKSPRQWTAAPLNPQKVAQFRAAWCDSGLAPLVIHDSYLINMASPSSQTREKSVAAMVDEIERADALGADFLVTHCGAHLGSGEEIGLQHLSQSLQICLEKTPHSRVKIALENTAAQGTCLGGPFEHLGAILKSVSSPRLAVCFDTCHAWAAGHDLVTNLTDVVTQIEQKIGWNQLAIVHLNDAKGALGKHLDRHEHLGQGALGEATLRAILTHPKLRDLPFLLETPEVETEIENNLRAARQFADFKGGR